MHLCAAKYKPPGECRQKGVDAPVSAVRFSVSISGVNVRKRRMLCVCCPCLLSRIHCRMHFTVLVSIALPVAALAVLKRKTGRGLLAALVGAGCFIGYALVLEQLLHAAVFSLFPAITLYPAAYTAYGCLAAGLFEETGRLMGLSLLCKKTGIWRWA